MNENKETSDKKGKKNIKCRVDQSNLKKIKMLGISFISLLCHPSPF